MLDNLISVNVYTHNRDEVLDRFLNSMSCQTYKNFEVNVIETANLDSTNIVVNRYRNLYPINYWRLHTKYVDKTKFLNFLARKSRGNIICIADADVMKQPDYLEEVNSKINENVFLIQFVKYLDRKNTHKYITKQLTFEQASSINELDKNGKSQIALSKAKFLAIGGFDERFFGWGYEDQDLYTRLCKFGLIATNMDSFGIHLWHASAWEFKGFRKDTLNLNLFNENIKKNIVIVKNEDNVRLDNQHDLIIREPVKSSIDFNFVSNDCQNDYIITTYLTFQKDPQRTLAWANDNFDIMKNFYESVIKQDLNCIILTDNLSNKFVQKYTTNKIKFVRCSQNVLNPLDVRWKLYYDLLRSRTDISKVFFSDISDIVVLKNPFQFMELDKIYCGDEESTIETNWWVTERFKLMQTSEINENYLKYKNRQVLNAGLLGGSRTLLIDVIEKILKLLINANITSTSVDMVTFNHVLYTFYNHCIVHGLPVNTMFKAFDLNNKYAWFCHK